MILRPPPRIYILENEILSLTRHKVRCPDELPRIAVGKNAKKNPIDRGEDGSVGADAESQSEDGDGGEAGIFSKCAQAIADILPELLQPNDTPDRTGIFFRTCNIAEFSQGRERASSGDMPRSMLSCVSRAM